MVGQKDIRLIKKPDDPACCRASCGGSEEIGYYCVFRGEKADVIACLENVLSALKEGKPVKVERE